GPAMSAPSSTPPAPPAARRAAWCCTPTISARPAFLFSSRRRHTRSKRDWSSDVCSSDLGTSFRRRLLQGNLPFNEKSSSAGWPRSEERRVGKECRARGGTEQWRRKEEQQRESRAGDRPAGGGGWRRRHGGQRRMRVTTHE